MKKCAKPEVRKLQSTPQRHKNNLVQWTGVFCGMKMVIFPQVNI